MKAIDKIMIAVDLEHVALSKKAVEYALTIGRTQAAAYQLITVVPAVTIGIVNSFLPREYEKKVLQNVVTALHQFSAPLFNDDELVKHIVTQGNIYEEINRIAKEHHSKLIIVAASKANGQGLGPNAARVARHSDKPVLIVR